MASGTTFSLRPMPPTTDGAAHNVRVGGSTPAEAFPVFEYDDTDVEYMDFHGMLEGYGGGGLTLTLPWAHEATSSTIVWGAAIRRIEDDADALDASHSYTYNDTASLTVPTVQDEVSYDDITFTDGTDMDDLADGEEFCLRVRLTSAAASGDARLLYASMILKET